MKKVYIVFAVSVAIFVFFTTFQRKQAIIPNTYIPSPTPAPDVLGVPDSSNLVISFDIQSDGYYKVLLTKTDTSSRIDLYPNFENPITAISAKDSYECTALTSAGFYTPESTPLGLFISDYQKLGSQVKSSLLDGYLTINDFETPRITRELPKDTLRVAIQSGPILIENNQVQTLSMKNDENARRMVAAVTGENELVLIAIFESENKLAGPLLANLPFIIEDISIESQIDFADAINLDGGAASAFVSDEITLTETSPVGSFLCVK